MTWVGLSDVATHFWCRDMMLAALWPFGVVTKALGRDRGKLPGCVATSALATKKLCTQPWARQRAVRAQLGLGCAHCAHDPVLTQCTV